MAAAVVPTVWHPRGPCACPRPSSPHVCRLESTTNVLPNRHFHASESQATYLRESSCALCYGRRKFSFSCFPLGILLHKPTMPVYCWVGHASIEQTQRYWERSASSLSKTLRHSRFQRPKKRGSLRLKKKRFAHFSSENKAK